MKEGIRMLSKFSVRMRMLPTNFLNHHTKFSQRYEINA